MTNQIGWYKMHNPSADYGNCKDELRDINCFWKKQVFTSNLQGQLDILHKVKWKRLQNIVAIYDYYQSNSQEVFVFMEKCNFDLSTFIQGLKEKEKNLQFYQNLIYQVSNGYLELKSLQILHRDIKPDNILVVEQNGTITYKICDFDISKKENDIQRLKSYNQKGTKSYSAPEIKESKYSYPADMFSFGLTIFQLLAGDNELNHNQKKLDAFYEKLKQKSFETIFKESTIKLGIDPSESQQIIKILNRMIVYQPEHRISWEDLNKYIQNLQEFEKNKNNNLINQPQKVGKIEIQNTNFKQNQQTLNHYPTTQNLINKNIQNYISNPNQQFQNLNLNTHEINIGNYNLSNQLNTTRERSNTLFDFDSYNQHLPQQNLNLNNNYGSAKKEQDYQNNQFQQKKLEGQYQNQQIHSKQPTFQFTNQPINNQHQQQLAKTQGQFQPNIQQQGLIFQKQNNIKQPQHYRQRVETDFKQSANDQMKQLEPKQFIQQFVQNKGSK